MPLPSLSCAALIVKVLSSPNIVRSWLSSLPTLSNAALDVPLNTLIVPVAATFPAEIVPVVEIAPAPTSILVNPEVIEPELIAPVPVIEPWCCVTLEATTRASAIDPVKSPAARFALFLYKDTIGLAFASSVVLTTSNELLLTVKDELRVEPAPANVSSGSVSLPAVITVKLSDPSSVVLLASIILA